MESWGRGIAFPIPVYCAIAGLPLDVPLVVTLCHVFARVKALDLVLGEQQARVGLAAKVVQVQLRALSLALILTWTRSLRWPCAYRWRRSVPAKTQLPPPPPLRQGVGARLREWRRLSHHRPRVGMREVLPQRQRLQQVRTFTNAHAPGLCPRFESRDVSDLLATALPV
jgi:hypothetical protein